MQKKFPCCTLVDPTNPHNSDIIKSVYKRYIYKSHKLGIFYSLTRLRVRDSNGNKISIYLTHDMFPFKKYQQTNADYLMTTDLMNAKYGGYGGTSDIYNSWKMTSNNPPKFNTKSPRKKRMLKISNSSQLSDKERRYFNLEQRIGYHTPHMGTRYPINELEGQLLLLMRKQRGYNLAKIIELCDANPNYLSVLGYLKITVNLLKALKTQVHDVKIQDEGQVIHGDIKPANIMVSKRCHIKIVDYGLATTDKNKHAKVGGTYGYIDPHHSHYPGTHSDTISDLFSVAKTLRKVWMKAPTSLRNINNLSPIEKNIILNALVKMTQRERRNRLSYEDALTLFVDLLKSQRKKNNQQIRCTKICCEYDEFFNLLDKDALLDLLKSKYAHRILGKKHDKLSRLPYIVKKLNDYLFEIPSKTLNWLKHKGMVIPENSRIIYLCLCKQTDISHLKKAIKLGAKVYKDDLIFWLEQAQIKNKSYVVAVAHLLYEHMSEIDRNNAYNTAIISNQFLKHFHRLLLKIPKLYDYDTEVRLINYHIELLEFWTLSVARTQRRIQNEPKHKDMLICTHISFLIENPPLLFALEQIKECLFWQRDFARYLRYRSAFETAIKAPPVLPSIAKARKDALNLIALEFNCVTGAKADDWQHQLKIFKVNAARYSAILKIEKALQRKIRHLCNKNIPFSPEDITNFNEAYASGNDKHPFIQALRHPSRNSHGFFTGPVSRKRPTPTHPHLPIKSS